LSFFETLTQAAPHFFGHIIQRKGKMADYGYIIVGSELVGSVTPIDLCRR